MNGMHFSLRVHGGFEDDGASRALRVNAAIGGHALATWLSKCLRDQGLHASEPWVEDHGWDFDMTDGGRLYLCACVIEDAPPGEQEAFVTVDLSRSFTDRVFGRNKFLPEDAVAAAIRACLAQEKRLSLIEGA